MRSISTSAIITGIRSKQDRSLGLSISTPELSVNEKAIFLEMQGLNINLLITPNDDPEAPEYKIAREVDEKTPSQRLRGVIYIMFEKQTEEKDFESFYRRTMDKIIEGLKRKYLDE